MLASHDARLPERPMTNSDHFRELDLAAALERLEDDRETLVLVAQVLLPQITLRRAEIDAAAARRDAPALARSAHALKGALSAVAATRAGGTAAELERAAHHGDWTACAAAVGRLPAELEALAEELARLPATLDAA
jgi:HPt (histidine-containing phosphotransfer) domain-containing protein